MSEHEVAIVSFMGALKRELKRVRRVLAQDESLSEFKLSITASGRVNDGDVKLSFGVADSTYATPINGSDLDATIEEFMRRRGWTKRWAPKALSYEKIPSDDTEETASTPTPDDEIPY